jgi:hypothetical protein
MARRGGRARQGACGQLQAEFDAGEAGAITLDLERTAELVDERLVRRVAVALGLRVTRILAFWPRPNVPASSSASRQSLKICRNKRDFGLAPTLYSRFSLISARRDSRVHRCHRASVRQGGRKIVDADAHQVAAFAQVDRPIQQDEDRESYQDQNDCRDVTSCFQCCVRHVFSHSVQFIDSHAWADTANSFAS